MSSGKKLRYLIKKLPKGKNSVKPDLLACVEERFNDFHIIRQLNQHEQRKDFKIIDIVYKPISNLKQNINCYFSKSMRNTYRVNCEKKVVKIEFPLPNNALLATDSALK